jgi:glucokinase
MKRVVVGIDLGGTNTAVGIVDREGQLLSEATISTTRYADAASFVQAICDLVVYLTERGGKKWQLNGIGIGAPNGNYYRGTIEYAPNLEWPGIVPLAEMLRTASQLPTVLTNDANAAAIGEMLFGGAREFRDFIVITLGTGVGSGIVVSGNLVYGHDGFAGEIGHSIYDYNGRECNCGRRGCLETYASASGIKRTVFELLANSNDSSELRSVSFDALTSAEIASAAGRGDRIARDAFEVTGRILGLKLADAVVHTSPAAIFLTGGLAKAGQLIFGPTQRHMEDNMLNIFKNKVKLLPTALAADHAAILGAAGLMWKELESTAH